MRGSISGTCIFAELLEQVALGPIKHSKKHEKILLTVQKTGQKELYKTHRIRRLTNKENYQAERPTFARELEIWKLFFRKLL